jgi:excisionase family DNA binding protein
MVFLPPPDSPVTVSVDEACRLLSIGRTQLYKLVLPKEGPPEIESIKSGRRRLVVLQSIYDYINRRRRPRPLPR